MAKITSNQLAFVDTTDSRKFEVYISSNLPQVQIYDQNKKTDQYSPDWSKNDNLRLTASVYLDSTEKTDATLAWYKNDVSTTKISSGKTLTISTNELSDESIISYICVATYQNLTAQSRITFTRIDSGLNGTTGSSAPAVQAQYSVDGLTGWTATLNASTHKYVQYSYDGGKTWTTSIKMRGDDGTSVKIVGTAYTPDDLTAGEVVVLYSDSNHSTAINTDGLSSGDSYLVSGYLCVYNADNNGFVCTGTIQGPAGNDGQSSYVFIRYATDANGTGISTNPSGKTYIGVYTSNTNAQPAASAYTWSKFVGDSAKNIALSANSQVFKMSGGSATPETITVTGRATNTSITTWEYSVNGQDFYTLPVGSTTLSGVSRTDNTTVNVTGSSLSSNSLMLRASDGTYNDVFTVYKAFDGSNGSPGAPASMAFLTNENVTFSANANGQITATAITTNVVAYSGTTKVTPTIGTISGLPTGMTATIKAATNNEVPIVFTIEGDSTLGSASNNNGSVTIPVNGPVYTNLIFNWSKVNSGAKGDEGVGIKSVTVTYGTSTSVSTQPTNWQSTIPTVAEGSYLWTRTVTDYTEDSIADTVTLTYAKQGVKGDTGSPGTPVTVSSIQYQAGTSATTAPTGTWSNSVVTVAEGSYLWTKTTFSDGNIAYGVAKQGVSGRGVSSVTEYYLATTASTGVSISTSGWTTTVQTIDATKKYLWNYELITYTDGATSTTTPVIIGVFGNTGAPGKGVSSVAERYLATTLSSGVTTSTSGWTPEIQVLTATNKYLWNYEIITYTDGTTSTISPVIIGVYGDKGDKGDTGNTGRGVSSIVEQYYQSTSATSQTDGSWSTTVPTWADGKYIWTRSVITYTDSTTSTTSPVCVTGQKGGTGGTGSPGVGVSSVDVWYYQSAYATSLSGGSWSTTAPTWSDGKYVWTKTIVTYTNNTTDETTAVCITGQKGSTGVGIKSVTEYYLATSSSSGVTTSTTGWTTAIQTITVDKKYLWNYEIITYTDNTTSTTTPIIIGTFGSTGKGIKSVTEYYLATTSSSGVTTASTGWTTTMQALTATNKYLWNYELITYTDNTTSTINPVIIGVYGDKGSQGDKGDDAYTVILTNESHVFAGDISNAIAANAETKVLAYKGSNAQSVTIVSVNGKTASTSSTATGIAGLSFTCSALSGTSLTITFACTTSFVSPNGSIPIVMTVGGVTITKMFTYSIAFKGAIGSQGSAGTPASIVSITPSAHYFKSTTGKDGTFTPDYIYLYPRFQTVTFNKWEYSINGGTTWVAASGANGLTISTYNSVANTLRIAKTSTLYTDTVTSISFRCVSSNASVYDTVSIAKIYDVVDLQIGGRNLAALKDCGSYAGGKVTIGKFTNITNEQYSFTTTDNPADLIGFIGRNLDSGKVITISGKTDLTKMTNYYAFYNNEGVIVGTQTNTTVNVVNGSFSFKLSVPIDATMIQIGLGLYPYVSNYTVSNVKIENGNKATDWSPAPEDITSTTFQIYAPDGYVLSNKLESLTLQTFAYEGSAAITSATYAWSYQENEKWVTIADETTGSLTVTKDDVIKTKTYRCSMTHNGTTYHSTATVQDISDVYDVMICVSDNINPLTGIYYWVVYALLYSEQGEADALLGPISIDAPESPVSGDYWYAIDGSAQTVTLKKYNGSAWVTSTDKQTYKYDWRQIIDGTQHKAIGNTDKVQIISCNSFTSNATFQCIVADTDGEKIARCNIHLTDTSDPIVSATAPVGVKDGQLWMQTQTDGTFLLYIWDADTSTWKQLNADTKNVVHTTKPSSYKAGDLWVVESDTAISGYTKGTLLQSNATTTTFSSAHWTPSLKYESELADVQNALKSYRQYMNVDEDGLHMQARDSNGTLSPFQALFTNTRLSFLQDDLEVAYISDNKLNIYEANIDILSVEKKIQLQKFEWAIESNGSMSLIVNY